MALMISTEHIWCKTKSINIFMVFLCCCCSFSCSQSAAITKDITISSQLNETTQIANDGKLDDAGRSS